MNQKKVFLISIKGRDQVGIISAVSACLFDAGANLADSSYSVLGEGFEFSAIADFNSDIALAEVQLELSSLPILEGARIEILPFGFGSARGASATITHVVEITGGDRPGLVAGISEVLMDYDANIVRMSSKTGVATDGSAQYRTRFAINAEQSRFDELSAAVFNTAGSMRLDCKIETV